MGHRDIPGCCPGSACGAAADAAATLDLPLTLTKRGCIVYATKAPQAS